MSDKLICTAVLALGLAGIVIAAEPPHTGEGHGWSSSAYVRALGRRFSFTISDVDLIHTPEWPNPETDPPPMSAAEAVHASRKALATYVPDASVWRLDEVQLIRWADGGRWFYVIGWKPQSPKFVGDGINIPVLMDGTCIPAKITAE